MADLARILLQNGYLSGMISGEMQKLISAVKNSVGHKEVKESVSPQLIAQAQQGANMEAVSQLRGAMRGQNRSE